MEKIFQDVYILILHMALCLYHDELCNEHGSQLGFAFAFSFFPLCFQKPYTSKHGKGQFEEIATILNGLCNYVQLFCTDSNFRLNCRQVWIRHCFQSKTQDV